MQDKEGQRKGQELRGGKQQCEGGAGQRAGRELQRGGEEAAQGQLRPLVHLHAGDLTARYVPSQTCLS